MKYLLTTIAITSTLIFAGCSKTKNGTIATLQPTEMEVDVEVDSGEIIVLVNGEEQTIDISEIMGNIVLERQFQQKTFREDRASHRRVYENNSHGERLGECPHGEQDGSEIREFMHELELFRGASHSLDDSNAVAMLGIQMIRDELEGEARMAALETIIEAGAMGSSSRNAALIVAIQTLKEEGNDQEAADYMVELVLSN